MTRSKPTHSSINAACRAVLATSLAAFALAAAAQTPKPAVSAEAVAAAFKRADTNQDGKLSKEEAARLPAIAEKFDQLDTNHDGFLSLEEFAVGFAAAN